MQESIEQTTSPRDDRGGGRVGRGRGVVVPRKLIVFVSLVVILFYLGSLTVVYVVLKDRFENRLDAAIRNSTNNHHHHHHHHKHPHHNHNHSNRLSHPEHLKTESVNLGIKFRPK